MKVVILSGGLGTRLREQTEVRPKPLVEIGGRPILWHIMKTYGAHGFTEFVLALGYRGAMIKDYFADYHARASDMTVTLATGEVEVRGGDVEDWTVHLVDTGAETQTGGRVKRAGAFAGDETFMLTYGDGVANVDVRALLDFHRSHGLLATVTAVRPPSRFGGLELDGDRVAYFEEKPQLGEGWINGGFFVCEPGVLELIDGDDVAWEREPLERLVKAGQLAAFRHDDFWQSMDTLRDLQLLETLWASGEAPWKVWT